LIGKGIKLDKLDGMKVFVEVAKHQSFIGASKHLNLSAPAVTRLIASLETSLGVKLFNRTTRHVRLTESGEHFLTDTKRILEDILEAESAVTGIYSEPKGTLTITAPVLFGEKYVLPIITEYLELNQEVTIKTFFSDRVTSLVEEELDIAIRIGHLKDSNLYATHVGNVRRIVCSSPSYLKKYGEPFHPADLIDHSIVFPTTFESSPVWHFLHNDKKEAIKLKPRLHCNQTNSALQTTLQGFGITRLMSYQVGEELEKGTLQSILTSYEEEPLPVNIIRIEGRRSNAKIRSFLDLATKRLKSNKLINSLSPY
jgi:DNA-binding transcriptional LysR family regulator